MTNCYDELKAIFDRYPRSEFRAAVKRLGRERLAPGEREKRNRLTPSQRLKLYARQNGDCARCFDSFTIRQLSDDHIVPISKGGTNHMLNRRLVCKKCNSQKSDADLFKESKRTGQSIANLFSPIR